MKLEIAKLWKKWEQTLWTISKLECKLLCCRLSECQKLCFENKIKVLEFLKLKYEKALEELGAPGFEKPKEVK